jgi:hypothetical protein
MQINRNVGGSAYVHKVIDRRTTVQFAGQPWRAIRSKSFSLHFSDRAQVNARLYALCIVVGVGVVE